jgi:hypothetical protein
VPKRGRNGAFDPTPTTPSAELHRCPALAAGGLARSEVKRTLATGLQVAADAFKQVFFLRGAFDDLEASRTSTDGDCTENNPLDQALEAWTKNRP